MRCEPAIYVHNHFLWLFLFFHFNGTLTYFHVSLHISKHKDVCILNYTKYTQCHKVIPLMWIQLNIYDIEYFTFNKKKKQSERARQRNRSGSIGLSWVCMSLSPFGYTYSSFFGNGRKFYFDSFWVSYSNRLRCKQTHFWNTIVFGAWGIVKQTEMDNVKTTNEIIKNGSANWFHSVFNNFPLLLLPTFLRAKIYK